jgi:hypothetical protein
MRSRYYRLVDDVHLPERWHLGEVEFEDGVFRDLLAGERIVGVPSASVRASAPGRELQFCLTSFAVPVAVTPLAVAMAMLAGQDLQRIPVGVDGTIGFEILNTTRKVRCLDELRTEFTKWTLADHRPDLAGQYRAVFDLHVRDIPVDAHIFRIDGWNVGLIVSDTMKALMEKSGCLGAKFHDVT